MRTEAAKDVKLKGTIVVHGKIVAIEVSVGLPSGFNKEDLDYLKVATFRIQDLTPKD